MKILQLRNATLLLSLGEHRILVDPMLSEPGSMPGFKLFGGGRRRNPLVPLPERAREALEQATAVLVTHEHPDHLDPPGLRWIKERGLPVWASPMDAPSLRKKGLTVHTLEDGALGMAVEVLPVRHGSGALGWLMGPVSSVYLAHPGEPSVYLTSDAVLDEALLEGVERLRPEVIVAPAGAASLGLGGDLLFSMEELMRLAHSAPGEVLFNHLEALDHCPITRAELRARVEAEGLTEKVRVPEDGEIVVFERRESREKGASPRPRPRLAPPPQPGFRKWLTAQLSGT